MKKRIIDVVVNVLAVIGIFCFLSAASTSDYYDSIGQYYAMSSIVRSIVVGLLLIVPKIIVMIGE